MFKRSETRHTTHCQITVLWPYRIVAVRPCAAVHTRLWISMTMCPPLYVSPSLLSVAMAALAPSPVVHRGDATKGGEAGACLERLHPKADTAAEYAAGLRAVPYHRPPVTIAVPRAEVAKAVRELPEGRAAGRSKVRGGREST